MLNQLKKAFRRITRPVGHFKVTTQQRYTWYGNTYGGFYLVGDLLSTDSIVYSIGIGQDVSFDLSVLDRHNCSVYGYDPTPKSVKWIAEQGLPQGFHFSPVGISDKSGIVTFYLPSNPDHVSGSIVAQKNVAVDSAVDLPMKTLTEVMEDHGHERIDVLKMDIEGAEYAVIDALLDTDVRPRQLLIEFHDRFFTEGPTRSVTAVEKLRAEGYHIFAVSDTYEEVSFIHLANG